MRHRHLKNPRSLSLMALDDVLDRGSPSEWSALVRLVKSDPYGPVADKILVLCDAHAMYGTSNLWRAIIDRLRRDATP